MAETHTRVVATGRTFRTPAGDRPIGTRVAIAPEFARSNAMDAACAACREQGPCAGCSMLALDDALNGRR